MPNRFAAAALRLRHRLVPDELQLSWMPFFVLGYLAFLFLPLLFGSAQGLDGWRPRLGALVPTLASVAVFLPLYFAVYRCTGARRVACMLAIAGLGYALAPINPYSNTYVIYAAGFAPFAARGLAGRMGWLALVLALYLAEIVWLGHPLIVFGLTLVVAVAVFTGNHFMQENARKRAELRLSHDEVRRLAALAERERIGRDLHDLLGHTLSLVALKSELACRLVERDPQAARRELAEVGRVARDALTQVRSAVTGIRAAGLAAELASARLLLEADGVEFRYSLATLSMPPALETVLAMTVREAVTNVQRHARAQRASIALERDGDDLVLHVQDDGRGGAIVPGNGLAGMRERIEALGGRLRIDTARAGGTRLEARLPLELQTSAGAQATGEQGDHPALGDARSDRGSDQREPDTGRRAAGLPGAAAA
ncbi:sensor histidine kinase [Cognatilysobacter bugurensis]|nr:sensor histidine kinase [Lysobacter bugurensis]